MPQPILDPTDFIERWQTSGAAERANFQTFALELCDILGVPRPDPATPIAAENTYVFEKSVPLPTGTTGRIDLYRRACFVLEAKQGSDRVTYDDAASQQSVRLLRERKLGTAVRDTAAWDVAMERAKEQAIHCDAYNISVYFAIEQMCCIISVLPFSIQRSQH